MTKICNLSTGCELLSNHYLCAKKNSLVITFLRELFVVNCFQIIIFVLRRTARHCNLVTKSWL